MYIQLLGDILIDHFLGNLWDIKHSVYSSEKLFCAKTLECTLLSALIDCCLS